MKEEYDEIEKYNESFDMFNIHKKQEENAQCCLTRTGNILVDEDSLNKCAKHLSKLFEDDRTQI